MSIENLKQVIKLVPDVVGHIKQAKVEREFPTDCRDSALASALEIEYMHKVAHEMVPELTVARVNKAVDLYDLAEEVRNFATSMVKAASAQPKADVARDVQDAELLFEGNMGGFSDLEKVASQAEELYDSYADYVNSDAVKIYAGAGVLNKQAAEDALRSRYVATGNAEFEKIARVLEATDVSKLDVDDNRMIVKAVVELEKSANIYGRGFNFYKEAFMTKSASECNIEVNLAGNRVTVGDIQRIGMDKIANYLGQDIADGMKGGVDEMTAVVNSLPLDSQQMLARLVSEN